MQTYLCVMHSIIALTRTHISNVATLGLTLIPSPERDLSDRKSPGQVQAAKISPQNAVAKV
jgi:hypothetical protein